MGCLCSKFVHSKRKQEWELLNAQPRTDAVCSAPLQMVAVRPVQECSLIACQPACPPQECMAAASTCMQQSEACSSPKHYVSIPQCDPDLACRDIHIANDKDVVEPRLHDCTYIRIHNCPRLTKLPAIGHFNMLETIRITHIRMHHCTVRFPDSLRTLEISYSLMREFRPESIPTLAQLNISFNNLQEIPQCIEPMWNANRNLSLNLRNNDFWWSMYSDLSNSMISPQTVKELGLAHKLGMLGTQKLVYAQRVLDSKRHSIEAKWLSKQIDTTLRLRKDEAHTTHNNSENIHLSSIQRAAESALEHILSYRPKHRLETNIENIIVGIVCSKELADHIRTVCSLGVVHSTYKTSFKDVLIKVYAMITDHSERKTLLDILRQELSDGMSTCLTGQITRLANALNGFVTNVTIGISRNEELSNSIVALRKKYATMYRDPEEYSNEAVPAVWQLLEDMCVPEAEHSVWLEYV